MTRSNGAQCIITFRTCSTLFATFKKDALLIKICEREYG